MSEIQFDQRTEEQEIDEDWVEEGEDSPDSELDIERTPLIEYDSYSLSSGFRREKGEYTVIVTPEDNGYVARDFATDSRAEGMSRGHALCLLGALIMRSESETSDEADPSLFELAGTLSDDEAQEAKEAVKLAREIELSKTRAIEPPIEEEDDT